LSVSFVIDFGNIISSPTALSLPATSSIHGAHIPVLYFDAKFIVKGITSLTHRVLFAAGIMILPFSIIFENQITLFHSEFDFVT
jgi:hypothetical protein